MAIKEFKYKVSSTENAEIIVEYAKKDRLGNQIDTTYAKKGEIPAGVVTTTDTLTANKIVLGNGNKTVKASTIGVGTTWSEGSDTTVPTMKAVETKISGLGGGTVTNVATGDGLTGGPITESGTIAVDSTVVRTSGDQTIAGSKLFSSPVRLQDGGTYEAQYDAGHIKYVYGANTYTYSFPQKTGTLALKSDIEIISAGTGLSKSETTLNHTDSITATTTVALKKFKYNGTGHITGVEDVTASDIPDLGAGKITSGTFSTDRIPTLAQNKITNLSTDLAAKEATANKESTVSDSTTKFPTSKAVKDFVNSSIEANAARYITSNAAGDAFSTKESLTSATKFYYAGSEVTLTRNDYCVVLADESKAQGEQLDNPTTRYLYTVNASGVGSWSFQYVVNNNPFTYAQMEAINSGASSGFVNALSSHYGDTSNPHSVTKDQVGLENVVNTGDSETPVQNGTTKFTTGGAYTLKTALETAIGGKQAKFTDGSASIFSINNNIVTLHTGVKQTGGAISIDTSEDVTLAAVASSGSYDDLSDKPTIPTSFNLTDDILDGSANKYAPYTSKGAGHLYTGTTAPSSTNRLNYDGYLYATKLYSGGSEVLTSQDISGKQDKVAKLGSTTKPVYTSAEGTFAECSTYAGGTAVTLNGTSKASSTASFYAPTSQLATGTGKYYLVGADSSTSLTTVHSNANAYISDGVLYSGGKEVLTSHNVPSGSFTMGGPQGSKLYGTAISCYGSNTANTVIRFPADKSGTVALTSDITTALTNFVTTDTAQTITGEKTFQGGLIIEETNSTKKYATLTLDGTDGPYEGCYGKVKTNVSNAPEIEFSINNLYLTAGKYGNAALGSVYIQGATRSGENSLVYVKPTINGVVKTYTFTGNNPGDVAVFSDITAANCGFVLTDYTVPTA